MTTLVTFLLDRSYSMLSVKNSTIESFNGYLDGLRKSKDTTISLIQFDTISTDTTFKNKPVKSAPKLTAGTFMPRGATPLIDACVKTIRAVEKVAKADDKVVICFQTDGEENSSVEHSWNELNALIKEKSALGWQFNFMGVGLDAYTQAARMGLSAGQTMSYDISDAKASRMAFAASAQNTAEWSAGLRGTTAYSAAQKRASGDVFDPDLKKQTAAPKANPKGLVDEPEL